MLAQTPDTDFGKNRVQFQTFNWRFYSTDNFDIFFYDDGEKNAKLALNFLEEEFEGITEIIGYPPYNKTKIFLYNSITDLQQSNVNIDAEGVEESGQTNFVQSQIEVGFNGSYTKFREDIVLKISSSLINEMMFGGSLADALQSTYLFSLPEWFIKGAPQYIAKGWSLEMDDYMRDLLLNQKVKKVTRFEGKDAEIVGHSIWNYIALEYGRSSISNILNLTRITRNEETGIANSIGVPFKKFLLDWQEFYSQTERKIRDGYLEHDDDYRLRRVNRKDWAYKNVKVSPNGERIAFSENYNGRYRVKIREIETGKEDVIFRGGYKVINQEVDFDIPLLSWKDNNTLGVINTKYGRNFMWLYEIDSKRKLRRDLSRFNHIKDFDFSPNGNLVVFSGDIYGQNDLFIMSLRRNAIKRLTDDPYDDITPKFVPNTAAIVFSSNRPYDSLKTSAKVEINEVSDYFNLYMYDLDTSKVLLKQLTNNLSKDTNPIPIDENRIYYLSDQKGIKNIYRFNFQEGVFNQVTNFNTSIEDFDLNYDYGLLTYTALDEGKEYVFFEESFQFDKNVFSPQTERQQLLQARFVSDRLRKRQIKEQAAKTESREEPKSQGSVIGAVPFGNDSTDFNYEFAETDTTNTNIPSNVDESIIDTEDYVFEEEIVKNESSSIIENYRKSLKEKRVVGPIPYKPKFRADNIVTSWVVDPLYGFGIKLNTEMADILENHRFHGGFVTTPNFESGTVFGEYEYLKYQVDYRGGFKRTAYILTDQEEFTNADVTQKYALNTFELGAALPFSVTSRVSIDPFYSLTNFFDIDPDGNNNSANVGNDTLSSTRHYVGTRLSFTYDNTISNGLNLREGFRAKAEYTYSNSVSSSENTFHKITLDARNYQKIHRELILATRVYYGRFFGDRTPDFFLGGVNNWIARDTNISGNNDPLSFRNGVDNTNILFSEFVTTVRGFDLNQLNGENVALFNAELRLPIVRFFSRGPISSNFFRNLMFVGFFDVGSAWNGGRFLPNNSDVNETVIPDNQINPPFIIRVRELTNPWLFSYGGGIRTILLGFYMKLDAAWPTEDFEVQSARFQVSLGYDF